MKSNDACRRLGSLANRSCQGGELRQVRAGGEGDEVLIRGVVEPDARRRLDKDERLDELTARIGGREDLVEDVLDVRERLGEHRVSTCLYEIEHSRRRFESINSPGRITPRALEMMTL